MCFNLKREASPLATLKWWRSLLAMTAFQSQARSQSPSDEEKIALIEAEIKVSISSEKPVP